MDTVTITREWHSPDIHITVDNKLISLSINLDDYLLALSEELGSPAFVFSRENLLKKMQTASADVITKVKKESLKAV